MHTCTAFQHHSCYAGPTFPHTSSKESRSRQRYIQTSIKKLTSSNSILLSFTVKNCEVLSGGARLDSQSCSEHEIGSVQGLSCEFLEKRQQDSLCSISKLFECQPTETCMQIGQTSQGECVSTSGLETGKDGAISLSDSGNSSSTPVPSYISRK